MGEHKMVICSRCSKIVKNCRCMSPDKKKEYTVCDACLREENDLNKDDKCRGIA